LYSIIHGVFTDVKNNIKLKKRIKISLSATTQEAVPRKYKIVEPFYIFVILIVQLNQDLNVVFSNSFW